MLGVDDGRKEVIEERGFDSLVVAEHTHIPASRDTPYPLGGRFDELGFGRVSLLPTLPADESLRLLDDNAELMAQYRG